MWRIAGTFGISDLKVYQWPAACTANNRYGKMLDGMSVSPQCLTAFDASFPLRYVAYAAAGDDQVVEPQSLKLDGSLEGWVADAMVGDRGSRLIPLVKAYDRWGRSRGAVGSVVFHFDRYYERSPWAIFGVTNKDIFAPGNADTDKLFVDGVDRIVRRLYLFDPHAEQFCYRDRSVPIKLFASIRNDGAAPCDVSTKVTVVDQSGKEIFSSTGNDTIPAVSVFDKHWTYTPPMPLAGGFYRIVTELSLNGKPYDRLENGFYVWDDDIVKDAPKYELKDNVFRVNGRPTYMPGADMHGDHIGRSMDGPLRWYEDAEAMRDFGFLQYETLDCWKPWTYGSADEVSRERDKLFAKLDAITLANRQAGIQYMPCQILGGDMAMGDSSGRSYSQRISDAAAATEDYYERLNFPEGIQCYIGGDIGVKVPREPWIMDQWNKFLKQRYHDGESLKAAWGSDLVGEPFEDKVGPIGRSGWASRRAMDSTDFVLWLEDNFISEVGGAVRKAAPGAVLCAEYPSTPMGGLFKRGEAVPDAWAGQQLMDISNVINAAYRLGTCDADKYPDLSLIGKPLTVGEWGNLILPGVARLGTGLTEPQGDECFLNENCQVFGHGRRPDENLGLA